MSAVISSSNSGWPELWCIQKLSKIFWIANDYCSTTVQNKHKPYYTICLFTKIITIVILI